MEEVFWEPVGLLFYIEKDNRYLLYWPYLCYFSRGFPSFTLCLSPQPVTLMLLIFPFIPLPLAAVLFLLPQTKLFQTLGLVLDVLKFLSTHPNINL